MITVASSSANIRSTPEFGNNIIGAVPRGFALESGDSVGDWIKVTAFVHKSVVNTAGVIPYHSQWEQNAELITSDCGETCCLMLAQSVGLAPNTTIDDCVRLLSNYDGYTSREDLIALLGKLGAKATGTSEIKPGAICLVDYSLFPSEAKQDVGYRGLHWVIVTAVTADTVTYHDPDFWGSRMLEGANRQLKLNVFEAACLGINVCLS